MAKTNKPRRGEIWLVRFHPSVGAEIRKARPAVVISRDNVGRLPLRIVVPLTDWNPSFAYLSWQVFIPASRETRLGKDSAADTFQVKSVSETRFIHRIGSVSDAQLDEIVDAIVNCVAVP
jgi:mRNA interferase MazF